MGASLGQQMHRSISRAVGPESPDVEVVSELQAQPRRLALWEIGSGIQCSIIGTCLSDADLTTALRKNRLKIEPDAESYDIHSYCVRTASQNTPFARALAKLLDRKFTGAVRLIGRADTEEEIRSIWIRLRNSGQTAAGYWAIMSHGHVPEAVRVHVFGEVHMLSHLNGLGAHQLALKLAEAERNNADLEARLRRAEQAKREALAERDAARSALATSIPHGVAPRGAPAGSSVDNRAERKLAQKLAKCTRALISARGRARHAEETLARLPARVVPAAQSPIVRELPSVSEARCAAPGHQRILYLGGRPAMVPHLREIAQARAAAFLHHDGGIEDSPHRIEEMIEQSDAVICPIDCVSHGACRMAKSVCQRLNKRFLPIPTASRAGFERALEQLSAAGILTRRKPSRCA
jgi:hypothetical protein